MPPGNQLGARVRVFEQRRRDLEGGGGKGPGTQGLSESGDMVSRELLAPRSGKLMHFLDIGHQKEILSAL